MTHTPEIVETREVSDQQVTYLIRCCGDQTTDSRHTIAVDWQPTDNDPRSFEDVMAEQKVLVAAKHEAKIQWRAKQSSATQSASSSSESTV